MNQSVIQIDTDPVGRGRERTCYLHPDDSTKLIKISGPDTDTQSRREIDFYKTCRNRSNFQYTHLPRYYGSESTSRGMGMVVDLICDFDGSVSKSLRDYLDDGQPISFFEPYLEQLKEYLLQNLVIFNHDMVTRNILFQRVTMDTSRLVLIDGIGDVVTIQWLNRFPFHARSKINRRWNRFLERLYHRLNTSK